MLDNMVKEQVDLKMVTFRYEQKSKNLHDLNRELTDEASKMQSLFSRRVELNTMSINEETGDSDDPVDSNVEQEKSLLITQIAESEHNIDRITREIDLSNTDLEDLSRRLDSANDSGSRTFSKVGRDVISSCSAQQCHPLVYDILCEKADVLEALYLTEEDLRTSQVQVEEQCKRIQYLEDELKRSSTEFTKRLEDAEKRRVNDIWTLVKSNSVDLSSESKPLIAEGGYDISRDIVLARAKDLEEEIDALILQDDLKTQELIKVQEEIKVVEEELMKSKLLQGAQAVTLQDDDSSQDLCFITLNDIWKKMGLSMEEKKVVIDSIVRAGDLARENALHEAETHFNIVLHSVKSYKFVFKIYKMETFFLYL